MSSISFDNVFLLFLIIPLVAIISVPFALAIRKDNANGHNIASFVIHIVIALLVSFAVAGTTITSVVTQTEVYVVADVSYSADRNLSTIDSYIQNVRSSLPANSKMGVVVFGRDYELLTELGGDIVSVSEANVDNSATDITAALSYAASLFHDGVIKRIVLITDGKQTDTNGYSELSGTINSLYENNIYVDAIYVDDNLSYGTGEVQISSVEYSDTTFLGRQSQANVVIQSGTDCRAIITLEVNIEGQSSWQPWPDENSGSQAVTLSQGSNVFNYDLCTTMSGTLNYRLTITSEDEDYTEINNTYEFTQTVVENYKVLVVTERRAEYNGIVAMYDEYAEITPCIVTSSNAQIPVTIEELCQYDEIVLANIDLRNIANGTAFVDALNTAVSVYGKSLVTYGNLYIQNQDDEVLNQLSDLLPVSYGSAEQDPKLVTFVIDNSLSMYQNGQLTRAKEAVIAIIDNMLDPEDYVAVVSFWGDNQVVYNVAKLSTNRDAIVEAISSIELQQGTDIGAGMQRAYDLIRNQTSFTDKQVFLFSDGLSYHAANYDAVEITASMYADGIYTSAVFMGSTAVNDDGTTADAEGQAAMESIASAGRGGTVDATNFYICNSDELFDEVVFGKIADNTTDSVISSTSSVSIASVNNEVVSYGDITSVPDVGGYYYSRLKASATSVLTVEYTNNSGATSQVPLYAYWNYGNGRVASFTTSFSAGTDSGLDYDIGWLSEWTTSNSGGEIIRNIGTSNIPTSRVDYPYTLSVEYSEGYASFEVTPSKLNASASATVEITSPDGTSQVYSMTFNSQTYTYGFTPESAGRYAITVTYSVGGEDYVATTYMAVPYLSEYDAFASYDAAILNRLLSGRGVVSEDGSITLENPENELATYTVSLTLPLLIAAVALFVVDIIIRKLKWNDIKSLFVKIK